MLVTCDLTVYGYFWCPHVYGCSDALATSLPCISSIIAWTHQTSIFRSVLKYFLFQFQNWPHPWMADLNAKWSIYRIIESIWIYIYIYNYIWKYVSAGSTSISVALIQIQNCTKATLSLRKVCLAAADESKPPASLVQLFEPGKEEPLLLGWTRLSMMNACPSKEVFSCYSGLHWISSVVGFFTFPFANLARHKSFNTNAEIHICKSLSTEPTSTH